MAEVRVPELPIRPEPVQRATALAEAVEVLLAGEGEARVDPRATARSLLPRHPAVGWLAQEPVPGRIEKGEPDRRRRHLDAEIGGAEPRRLAVVNRDRRGGPVARDDEGRPGVRRAPEELDAHAAQRGVQKVSETRDRPSPRRTVEPSRWSRVAARGGVSKCHPPGQARAMRRGRGRAPRVGHLLPGTRVPPPRDRSHPIRPSLSSGECGN